MVIGRVFRRDSPQFDISAEIYVLRDRDTPIIVKYPFWQMTLANRNAVYACVDYGEAFCPGEIADRSICIDGDIGEVLKR